MRPCAAALGIDQRAIEGVSEAPCERGDPAHLGAERVCRIDQADVTAPEVGPTVLAFDADHPVGELIVGSTLKTGEPTGCSMRAGVEGRTGRVGPILVAPAVAGVATDINAGPVEGSNSRPRGRLYREVRSACG